MSILPFLFPAALHEGHSGVLVQTGYTDLSPYLSNGQHPRGQVLTIGVTDGRGRVLWS
ncbi:hypothetical protein DPMN_165470 [Dreissena polymorpha]|uniref:Uncharacterized protein n=1 Tax=Dreissena polymorpha TaxID=45954 RepID=A0A9D4EZQ7_DREPO|nr:hypothetical protein DPMN_165470 [Dreissena polymorpha]